MTERNEIDSTDYLMSVNALAKHFGVDRRTVERRLKNVKPARVRRIAGRNFKFYDAIAVADVLRAPSDSEALKAAFERLHALKADAKAVKRAIRVKELMTNGEAEEVLSAVMQTLRARVLGLDGKLAPMIVQINNSTSSVKERRKRIQALIESEIEPIARLAESILEDTRLLS